MVLVNTICAYLDDSFAAERHGTEHLARQRVIEAHGHYTSVTLKILDRGARSEACYDHGVEDAVNHNVSPH